MIFGVFLSVRGCSYLLCADCCFLELFLPQQYDAFERNDVKLQEDMKHAKALIKKQQVCGCFLFMSGFLLSVRKLK